MCEINGNAMPILHIDDKDIYINTRILSPHMSMYYSQFLDDA